VDKANDIKWLKCVRMALTLAPVLPLIAYIIAR
jgi:hypothetical protein